MTKKNKYEKICITLKKGDERLEIIDEIKKFSDKYLTSSESSAFHHYILCLERRGYMLRHHYNSIVDIYERFTLDEND
jgi:hypothetical protein